LLNWRETSSNPIITELANTRIHTTREAKARKEFVTSLARPKRRRLADDIGENLFTAVGFVFD
jgi:hypothetical protein